MSKLSNRQNVRLGGLIAVMGKRIPYQSITDDLLENGLVEWSDEYLFLTEKGVNEKDRLAILAGLMVEDEYVSTREKNLDKIRRCNGS